MIQEKLKVAPEQMNLIKEVYERFREKLYDFIQIELYSFKLYNNQNNEKRPQDKQPFTR